MAFEYVTNITAVINILKLYNTTTASPDLSTGLNVRVDSDNIILGDIKLIQPRADRMPALFIKYNNKREEYAGIGATGPANHKKQATVIIQISGLVGKYGGYESDDVVLTDLYKLAANCETVFQKEFTLNNTALWCNPGVTNFETPFNYGEGFSRPFIIELEAEYLFR
jgi:hypothetical protein